MKTGCALLCLLALTACAEPSRTDGDFKLKAGNTAKAVASSLATAELAAKAARQHKAGGPYLTVVLVNAEKDVLSVQGTFDSVQPPDDVADAVRSDVDELLASATAGLATMRIDVRRGELDRLSDVADGLLPTLKKLQTLADTYQ